MLGQFALHHRVEDPVARHLFDKAGDRIEGRCRAGGAAGNEISTSAQLPIGPKLVKTPEVETVPRHVCQKRANRGWIILRAYDPAIEIGVAAEQVPPAGKRRSDFYLRSIHA